MKQQTADEDLSALRGQLAQKDAALAGASGEAEQLKTRLGQEVAQRVTADENTAKAMLAQAEGEAAAAEKTIAEAGKAGDWAALAKAQRSLSTAQTRIDSWTAQSQRIASWKQTQLKASAAAPKEPVRDEFTPKTRAWLDSHPSVRDDPAMMQRAVAAHLAAVAEGLTPESDEYFGSVETRLGLKEPEAILEEPNDGSVDLELEGAAMSKASDEEERKESDTKPQRTAAVAAAPSNRTPVIGKGAPGGRIRLSADEQEAARFSFPRLKPDEAYAAYARNKRDLIKDGVLPNG